MGEQPDPSAIRSLAVAASDVVDAFAYTRENPDTAVLRATPPVHGRMRARLHVYRRADERLTGAVHVDPAALLEDEVVAAYPTVDETRRRLEAGEGGFDPDSGAETDGAATDPAPADVREARADALEAWRERALDAIVDAVAVEPDEGSSRVDVVRLA